MTASETLQEIFGGEFSLLASRDNDVWVNSEILVKLARHPDGHVRLQTGLTSALELSAIGAPVVAPLYGELFVTPIGPATAWPLISHRALDQSTLDTFSASAFGAAIASVTTLARPREVFHPFVRAPYRLASSSFPDHLITRAHNLVESISHRENDLTHLDQTFAHGDASVSNALFIHDNSVQLIDFDSAASRPIGWDMACLFVHLALEAQRGDIYETVRRSYEETSPIDDDIIPTLALIKAVIGTTFAMTFDPTPTTVDLLDARLAKLEIWAKTGQVPSSLPALA